MTELVEYKAKGLLFPILMCSLLNLLLTKGVLAMGRDYSWSIGNIFGALPVTDLWFLWSLLASCVALSLAVKITKTPVLQGVLIFGGFLLAALFPNWTMNVFMYPYFIFGYVYARKEEILARGKNVAGVVSTIVFVVMLFFFEKKHYIYTSGLLGGATRMENLSIDTFRWGIGLFGAVSVIWLSGSVYNKIKPRKLMMGLEVLGKDSLAVYALSASLLSFWLPRLVGRVLGALEWIQWNRYIWLYNLVVTPVMAMIYAGFLLLVIKGFKKMGVYRLFFGR